jgi:predicted nucleic acid-binding protein
MVRRNAGGPGVTHGLDTSFLVAAEVTCHADHTAARALASSLRQKGDQFALAPQALAEFVHVVTDARWFTAPLTVPQALERAQVWWNASDVEHVWPDEAAAAWFFAAMARHQLGRKRVLDTLLAGTFHSANTTSVLTLNAADFAVFGEFTCVPLAAAPAAQT